MTSIVSRIHAGREFMFQDHPTWKKIVEGTHLALPNIQDLDHWNRHFLSQAHLSKDNYERLFKTGFLEDIDWATSMGSTLLFTAVMVFLAVRHVSRRDY